LQELYVTVTKKVSTPLPPGTALEIISDLGEWIHHVPDVGDIMMLFTFNKSTLFFFLGRDDCKQRVKNRLRRPLDGRFEQ